MATITNTSAIRLNPTSGLCVATREESGAIDSERGVLLGVYLAYVAGLRAFAGELAAHSGLANEREWD